MNIYGSTSKSDVESLLPYKEVVMMFDGKRTEQCIATSARHKNVNDEIIADYRDKNKLMFGLQERREQEQLSEQSRNI